MKPIRLLIGLCLFTAVAHADVKPSAVFSDHMVLQRDAAVPVWGTDSAGQSVTVKFADQEKTAVAGADGKWLVNLDAMPASADGRAMTIAGSSTVTVNDVLVGEVWLLSGQSNMLFTLPAAVSGTADLKAATDPAIRFMRVDTPPADEPLRDVPMGNWLVGSPEACKSYSAVGYYFARKVRDELKVPIGLIQTACDGVRIQTWIPRETLLTLPEGKDDVEKYDKLSATWDPEVAKKQYDQVVAKYEEDLKKFEALPADQQKPELKPMKAHEPIEPKKSNQHVAGLYNGRLAPLMPYAIRGALWYQGEANGIFTTSYLYRQYLPAMITSWRAAWGQGDFPFLFVQLPNFDWGSMTAGWPTIRESMLIASRTPNTAMVVSADVGDPKNLHPRNKKPVGERLALAAMKLAYGRDVVASGPVFDQASFADGKAVLKFKEIGGGLVAKSDTLTDFQIAGADQIFAPATATIDGQTVVVSSPSVGTPVAVRYGWAPAPLLSLYNKEALPASPFRTDDWPIVGHPAAVQVAAGSTTKSTTSPTNKPSAPSASLPIPDAPPAPPGPPAGHMWEPLPQFTDDFNGDKLDTTKWDDHDPKWIGRQPALFLPSNVELKDGILRLTAKLEDVPAPANPDPKQWHTYTSSFVKSKTQATYGYYEIRAKPMNSNIDSAFWFYGIEPDWHTEIDVFEIPGGNTKEGLTDRMTIHIFKTPDFKEKNKEFYKSGEQWHAPFRFGDDFHIYGLEWDEQFIKWSVDGVIRRIAKNEYNHRPMNLCLDDEVMLSWFGKPTNESLPAIFEIDYVHAWRRTDAMPATQP